MVGIARAGKGSGGVGEERPNAVPPRRTSTRPTTTGAGKAKTKDGTKAVAAPPKVPGWTSRELAEVRARLEQEIEELQAAIARAESEIAAGDPSEGAGDDQADTGAKTFEREHEISLTYNARDLVAQNERATARIDAGTYGLCESCGQPIGKARLQAFPRATLCVECKQREERR